MNYLIKLDNPTHSLEISPGFVDLVGAPDSGQLMTTTVTEAESHPVLLEMAVAQLAALGHARGYTHGLVEHRQIEHGATRLSLTALTPEN